MKNNIPMLIINLNNLIESYKKNRVRLILIIVSGLLFFPLQQSRSKELFLKCIGKYELNRGALINPDWEISYIKINLDGLMSVIDYKGKEKKGRTLIRQNSYTITQRDDRNIVKNIYRINRKYLNYTFESPKRNRTLIGTCQKGRG